MPKKIIRPQHDVPRSVQVCWPPSGQGYAPVTVGTCDETISDREKAHCPVAVEMDRRSINDLIRALRVARDAAFGRDE